MSEESSFSHRFDQFTGGKKVRAFFIHFLIGAIGFVISELGVEKFLEWWLEIPCDVLTDIKKLWISFAVGLFAGLGSFWRSRFWEETSQRYSDIKGAVDEFLRLIHASVSSISDTPVASSEERFRNFMRQFAARDDLLRSLSQSVVGEAGRLFAIAEKAYEGEQGEANYHDQIKIASVLCRQGHLRFWATSTDPAMVFHQNALYYHALEDAAEKYHEANSGHGSTGNPPYLCRIFLCPEEDLDYSLTLYAMDFLEMYRRHILWADQENHEPIKFLFWNETPQALIERAGGTADDLEDFMVVDEAFVFGRKGPYRKHATTLRLFRDKTKIDRYARIFCNLYNDKEALDVFQILDKKINNIVTPPNQKDPEDKARLEYYKTLCGYIRRKARNKVLYGERFSVNQQRGHDFFDRVCALIEESTGGVVAADIADKKVSPFYKAWLDHRTYRKFRHAGRAAVEHNRPVFRLFILKAKPEQGAESDIKEFLKAFLQDSVKIGFLFENEAGSVFPNEPEKLRYEVDFLLGSVPTDYLPGSLSDFSETRKEQFKIAASQSQAFGFELFGDEPFLEEMLDWERNLVDMEGMWRKVESFTRLWAAVPVGRIAKHVDVNEENTIDVEVKRLWTELIK